MMKILIIVLSEKEKATMSKWKNPLERLGG